jgi:hypothetical protein
MDNLFPVHVSDSFKELLQEEASTLLTDSACSLTKIVEDATWNVVKDDVDKVWDLSS